MLAAAEIGRLGVRFALITAVTALAVDSGWHLLLIRSWPPPNDRRAHTRAEDDD